AILFRDKMNDLFRAASAFDRAGDVDEALRLYVKLEQFETAGDLCRRIGDDDRAGEDYSRAAELYAAAGRFLAAGDLMRTKAGRTDKARVHYRSGWDKQGTESGACGIRVFDDLLVEDDWPTARTFLDEAEQVFVPPRNHDAAAFFNQILTTGRDLLPAGI